jgi:hypothetical protein
MQAWSEFFAVVAAASATLLGLLFVAISVNAAESLGVGHEPSRRLAEQAFQNYLTIILVSLVALLPQLKLTEFGSTALGLTASSSVLVLVRLYFIVAKPHADRLRTLRRHVASVIGFAMLMFAGLRLALGYGDTRNLFAAATIVLLSSATLVSWELLVRIADTRRSEL